jgi:hypothetical protein
MMPKETVEAVKGFIKLSAILAEVFKDGVQASDLAPILVKLQDPAVAAVLQEAYNGIDKVPSELKEVSAVEAIEALAQCAPEMIDLLKAIKK